MIYTEGDAATAYAKAWNLPDPVSLLDLLSEDLCYALWVLVMRHEAWARTEVFSR